MNAKSVIEKSGILGVFGTVLLALAAYIQTYSHTCSIWILFLSLITYSQLLRVEFIAHGKSPFVSNWAGGIASVLSLVLCVILQVAELSHPASPKPHLKLVLDAVDAKKVNVVLTNDFLFGLSFSNFMDAGKVLLIPIELGTSNVTLEFSVINDSDAIASDAEVVFAGPTGLNCLKNAF
jgi:hypothetical protein